MKSGCTANLDNRDELDELDEVDMLLGGTTR